MVEMDEILAFLEAKKRRNEHGPLLETITVKNVQLKDGTTIGEAIIDQDTPEEERETVNKLLNAESTVASSSFSTKPLSEVVEMYCDEQESINNKWIAKTAKENRASFALFVRVVGDDEVFSELQFEQLLDFKSKILKLPAGIKTKPQYRTKSIDEILQMPDVPPMARNTQNKHLNRICGLFKWAVINGLTDKNYASGLPIGKDKNARSKVDPFTDADLIKLFESPEYREYKFKCAYQYWVPLIALYTGARLNEICQLHLQDIKQVGDLYYFDFNDEEEDQRLKNSNSRREVPIHTKLVDLGIMTYINQLKLSKETRLFPDIKRNSNGSYSDAPSKWYSRYMKKQEAKDGRNKVFHSLRHTVIDQLKQKLVTLEIIAAIVGHENGSVTFDVYGNKYQPEVLQEFIDMLEFDVQHTEYHQV